MKRDAAFIDYSVTYEFVGLAVPSALVLELLLLQQNGRTRFLVDIQRKDLSVMHHFFDVLQASREDGETVLEVWTPRQVQHDCVASEIEAELQV